MPFKIIKAYIEEAERHGDGTSYEGLYAFYRVVKLGLCESDAYMWIR